MSRIVSLFMALLTVLCPARLLAINPHYHLQKKLAVADSDLTVQLIADNRMSKDTVYEDLPENALNAKVQVVANGKALFSLTLETPRADIEWLEGTPKGTHLLFLTEDKTIDFGSYNGPISVLYSLDQGRLAPVMAVNPKTEKKDPMSFMRALKENWRVVKTGLNRYPQIYSVSCRPFLGQKGKDVFFKTTYSRYFFEGNLWKENTRTVKRLWENEGPFPPKRLFP